MHKIDHKKESELIDKSSDLIKRLQESILLFEKAPKSQNLINGLFVQVHIYIETLRVLASILYSVIDDKKLSEKVNLLYENAHRFIVDNIDVFNLVNENKQLTEQIRKREATHNNKPSTSSSVHNNKPSTSSDKKHLTDENLNKLMQENKLPNPYIAKIKIIDDWIKKVNEEGSSNHSTPSSHSPSSNSSGSDSLYRSSERLSQFDQEGNFMVDPKKLADRLDELSKKLESSK
jgi:hypothetical protein